MSRRLLLALATCGAVLHPARAAAQVYVVDPGTLHSASAVSDAMFASQLVGMTVEVRFSDGTSSSGIWQFLAVGMSGPRYGVVNDLFAFQALGDQDTGGPSPSLNDFNLANFNPSEATIVGLVLRGAPAGAVFDRGFGGMPGTPGSGPGRDVVEANDPGGNEFAMTVTYRDAVGVAGAAPVGDLFASIDVVLGNGVPQGENYSLFLDTDVAVGLTTVPEPATVLLVGGGLAALAAARRRRGTRGRGSIDGDA